MVRSLVAVAVVSAALGLFPVCADGAAWTMRGKPIPYTNEFDNHHPTDVPGAVIPVEKIRGPLFLDCGRADWVWTSCSATLAIVARLKKFHSPNPLTVLTYSHGGHGLGALIPYEPNVAGTNPRALNMAGDTATANALADADRWPRLLAFLHRYG